MTEERCTTFCLGEVLACGDDQTTCSLRINFDMHGHSVAQALTEVAVRVLQRGVWPILEDLITACRLAETWFTPGRSKDESKQESLSAKSPTTSSALCCHALHVEPRLARATWLP